MKAYKWFLIAVLACLAGLGLILACGSGGDDDSDDGSDDDSGGGECDDDDGGDFDLTSSAFENCAAIPAGYACTKSPYSPGVSPPLAWSGAPEGAAAFALLMRDPDAGETPHWGLINIPADLSALAEGISPGGDLPEGAWETLNYREDVGYGGPCPPSGSEHVYRFTLFALDAQIENPGGAVAMDEIAGDVQAHSIAAAKLRGVYGTE